MQLGQMANCSTAVFDVDGLVVWMLLIDVLCSDGVKRKGKYRSESIEKRQVRQNCEWSQGWQATNFEERDEAGSGPVGRMSDLGGVGGVQLRRECLNRGYPACPDGKGAATRDCRRGSRVRSRYRSYEYDSLF